MKSLGADRKGIFKSFVKWSLASALVLISGPLQAAEIQPVRELLGENVPMAFSPTEMDPTDFQFKVESGALPEGLKLEVEAESLEWVRVSRTLVLPRGRLMFRLADGAKGFEGHASQDSFVQSFRVVPRADKSSSLVVGLLPGPVGRIRFQWRMLRDDAAGAKPQWAEAVVRVVFLPQDASRRGRFVMDASCSPFKLNRLASLPSEVVSSKGEGVEPQWGYGWTYVGCKIVQFFSLEGRSAALEMLVFRANESGILQVDGALVPPVVPGVWALRAPALPGETTWGDELAADRVKFSIPNHANLGFLGAGLGPYGSKYESPEKEFSGIAPVLTLYSAYYLTDLSRLVAFDLMPLRGPFATDVGLYVQNESFKILDERLTFYLMLGIHGLGFQNRNQFVFNFGLPQGFEMVFRDFMVRRTSLVAGAFIYPTISGRSYYNAWIRWGSPNLFGEFNYVQWRERVEADSVFSRNIGFCLGVPLARFL